MGVVVRLKQVNQKKIDDFFFVFVDSRRLLFEPSKSQYFFFFQFFITIPNFAHYSVCHQIRGL